MNHDSEICLAPGGTVAADSGLRIYVCQMSMDLMGYKMEEMIDYPNMKSAGVGKFLGEAGTSKVTLFI